MFRPPIEVGKKGRSPREKEPDMHPRTEEAACDDVDSAAPAGDIKALEQAVEKAERRLNRARSRLEQIESDLVMAEDEDDVEELRKEQKEAQGKKDSAMKDWQKARGNLDRARAKAEEEARVEAAMVAAESHRKADEIDEKRSASFKKAKARMEKAKEPVYTTPWVGDLLKEENERDKGEEHPELPRPLPVDIDQALPAEPCEDLADIGPMPKKKKFKWTPLRAIAVGLLVCLVLPVILYGFVIPRADVTVRTWYYEGFQSSIVIDAKIINDGSVEVRNVELNVSILKEVEGVEVYIAELSSYTTSVGLLSEKRFEAIDFHDDQNERYVIIVQIRFDAGDRAIYKSFTHKVDDPYMSIVYEDRVQELAF